MEEGDGAAQRAQEEIDVCADGVGGCGRVLFMQMKREIGKNRRVGVVWVGSRVWMGGGERANGGGVERGSGLNITH